MTDTYKEYKETGDKNIFEDIIDKMILDQVAGMNESFRRAISSLPKKDKRMAILSLLDKDRNLFTKIKDSISNESLSKLDHVKDTVLMLREYVKIAEVEKKKFGEVMTPLDLVKEMLATLPKEVWSNPNLKWLDPANGTGPFPIIVIYKLMKGLEKWQPDENLRYKHIIENMIYACELQPKNMFLYLCTIDPKDELDCNIYTGSFLEDEFDRHMKEVWNVDKFDIIIGNPPYNQMIDMLFLSKSYNISDSLLFVHPSTWLLDEKGKQKKFTNTKELIKEHLESITLFNGNSIFNIELSVPCVISYINKLKSNKLIFCNDRINNKELYYTSIYDINKYSDISIYPTLKQKILSKAKIDSIWKQYKKSTKKKFVISFSGIVGHTDIKNVDKIVKNDFYIIVSKSVNVSTIEGKSSFINIYFDKEEYANNFLNFTKTNFCRFCLSIYKSNKNIHRGELDAIPWLDFSREWSNEDLIKEFELTGEEVEFINKNIPEYY